MNYHPACCLKQLITQILIPPAPSQWQSTNSICKCMDSGDRLSSLGGSSYGTRCVSWKMKGSVLPERGEFQFSRSVVSVILGWMATWGQDDLHRNLNDGTVLCVEVRACGWSSAFRELMGRLEPKKQECKNCLLVILDNLQVSNFLCVCIFQREVLLAALW